MVGEPLVVEPEPLRRQLVLLEQAGPEQQRVVAVEAAAHAGVEQRREGGCSERRDHREHDVRRRADVEAHADRRRAGATSSGSSTARTPCWMRSAPSASSAPRRCSRALELAGVRVPTAARRRGRCANAPRTARAGTRPRRWRARRPTTPSVGVAHRDLGLRDGVGRIDRAVGGDHQPGADTVALAGLGGGVEHHLDARSLGGPSRSRWWGSRWRARPTRRRPGRRPRPPRRPAGAGRRAHAAPRTRRRTWRRRRRSCRSPGSVGTARPASAASSASVAGRMAPSRWRWRWAFGRVARSRHAHGGSGLRVTVPGA